jgi:D-tagatose-1,6-bisphosphate aldolase subunit GatZ/KbaZ
MNANLLDKILRLQKQGQPRGIPSICSAHPWVLKAALRGQGPLLIESTCNQVNQFGGYTGMTPAAFAAFVRRLAAEAGFPLENLLLGGDHLGPSPWQDGPMERAMQRAAELVQVCVQTGYTKIHLDASMRLADDDPSRPLDVELAARRSAWLAKAAEACADPSAAPRYVIGTEVPVPGGTAQHEQRVRVTRVEDAQRTLDVTHAAFMEAGLESAWERVIALVVQPGVEFGGDFVLDYVPEAACDLVSFAETIPLVYEVHSTDYQRRENLRCLVSDHFAILKVGPALTYAFREAVFALVMIESELFPAAERSHLIEVLDDAMQREPAHWEKHYRGSGPELTFARRYGLSDRIRYYWPAAKVQAALERLLANLGRAPVPLTLLSQFMPVQCQHVRTGDLANNPAALIMNKIGDILADYRSACGQ